MACFPQAEIPIRTNPTPPDDFHDTPGSAPLKPFPTDDLCTKHGNKIPARPKSFDGYLYPTLTSNERVRLTLLWYYTRGLHEDAEILARLQDKVELVKIFTGWEFAVCGLLSNDIFQRIAAAGMPLTTMPRRESPCSHTVQAAGVFHVPDMTADWRFVRSPQVCHGGLRSYAGARLQCRIDGQDVALGSLCVASDVPNKELSPAHMEILLKFADMLTADIVNGAQQKRMMQQLKNDALLRAHHQDVNAVLSMLKDVYPHADVGIVRAFHGVDIWEDEELIDELLRTKNHTKLMADRPIRAVSSHVRDQLLVVSTKDPVQVFDDVDLRFVKSCALAIVQIMQDEELKQALDVRANFMRGITHQLRTPIHGILGSVALLMEEGVKHESLSMIKDSGLELASTVNNIIKFNQSTQRKSVHGYLDSIEVDILDEVSWDNSRVALMFNNKIPGLAVTTDLVAIRDCLQPLVQNAFESTVDGSVVVTISAKDFTSLVFDIEDTGCGIPDSSYELIFEAYEKCDVHSRGAGLGLTLARRIAEEMNGTVTLVSSEVGKGSHFRAEFKEPGFSCYRPEAVVPQSFFIVTRSALTNHFAEYLKTRGWIEKDDGDVAVVATEDLGVKKGRVSVSLAPTDVDPCVAEKYPNVMFFSGPFTSARLKTVLRAISGAIETTSMKESNKRDSTHSSNDYKPKCLLVDDNAINLRILCHFCDKRQFNYTIARDGFQAIDEYKRERPELILLDLQMPRCDGIQACEEIRAYEVKESLRPAKVFIVTGQDSPLDRQKATAAGADKFLVKPLVLKTLDRAISLAFAGE